MTDNNKIIRTEYGCCPICNGKGYIPTSGASSSVHETCYHCNGTKSVISATETRVINGDIDSGEGKLFTEENMKMLFRNTVNAVRQSFLENIKWEEVNECYERTIDNIKNPIQFQFKSTETPSTNTSDKPVLFRTEDDVDIRDENLEIYSVCPKSSWETRVSTYEKMNWRKEKPDGYAKGFKSWLHFYSKERMYEYILNHKPCLSLDDIAIGIPQHQYKEIEKLAKQKLNL